MTRALSLEISDLAYFIELQDSLLLQQLNNKPPLIWQMSRDRANDAKVNESKKNLRRRRRQGNVSNDTGNTKNASINAVTRVQQRPPHASEADQAAGGVVNTNTPAKDSVRAARSA